MKTASAAVAPRAGAWIETFSPLLIDEFCKVAPRAGAWIETASSSDIFSASRVAPRAGAWIETNYWIVGIIISTSLLAQERGLKHFIFGINLTSILSLLAQERGLKPFIRDKDSMKTSVAPRAGAWIETELLYR